MGRGRPAGYRHSEETKRKIAESNRGKARSTETRANISAARKAANALMSPEELRARHATYGFAGRKQPAESIERTRSAHQGRIYSSEVRAKMAAGILAQIATLTPEERRQRFPGAKVGHKGVVHTDAVRRRIGDASIERMAWIALVGARGETQPERRVAEALTAQAVPFIPQHPINRWVVDFYLPDTNTVIEVQGCYWHACPPCGFGDTNRMVWARDRRKAGYLAKHEIPLIEIWEHDIMRPDFDISPFIPSYS